MASKLTDASMKFQLQTVNNVHFFIEAASIKLREVKGVRFWSSSHATKSS